MISRRHTTPNETVSLFPFLAVLLCTMGALLVLLVIIARQARVRTTAEVSGVRTGEIGDDGQEREERGPETGDGKQKAGQTLADNMVMENLEIELASLRNRGDQLDQVHREGQSRFSTAQLRLGHVEEQIRQLRDGLADVYSAAEEMEELDETHLTNREQAEQEHAQLNDLISETEAEIEHARQDAAKRPKSYAIIPYEGANGTHRRPLYIECREHAVVLLPEGIELTPDDLLGPVGPGNPLAAAPRAAREYYTDELDDPTAIGAQPYPLLLVRPGGIEAYYQARKAIASWGPDFGYELIGGDWPLELPPADPQLAHLEYRAVEAARSRQRQLAQAAPRRFGGGLRRDGKNGGGGPFFVGQESRANGRRQPAGRLAADGNMERRTAGGRPEHRVTGVRQLVGENTGSDNPLTSRDTPPDHDVSQEDGVGKTPSERHGRPAIAAGEGNYAPKSDPRYTEKPVASGTGTARFSPPTGSPQPRTGDNSHQPPAAHRSERPVVRAKQPTGTTNGTTQGTPGGTTDKTPGGSATFGSATPPMPGQSGGRHGMGGSRKSTPRDAIPIRRAIHVVVRRSQLAIFPEPGAGGGRVVPITNSEDDALNEFVLALQERTRSWGIAGHGLFWKPILVLKPTPDGMARAQRLARRLRNSGIEIQVPGTSRR